MQQRYYNILESKRISKDYSDIRNSEGGAPSPPPFTLTRSPTSRPPPSPSIYNTAGPSRAASKPKKTGGRLSRQGSAQSRNRQGPGRTTPLASRSGSPKHRAPSGCRVFIENPSPPTCCSSKLLQQEGSPRKKIIAHPQCPAEQLPFLRCEAPHSPSNLRSNSKSSFDGNHAENLGRPHDFTSNSSSPSGSPRHSLRTFLDCASNGARRTLPPPPETTKIAMGGRSTKKEVSSTASSPTAREAIETDLSFLDGPHQPAAPSVDWYFDPPPNNQRTFYFAEDNLEFSSDFDSGNLIQVERTGPLRYNMYNAMDCGNAETQTNNRQWFHFAVRGGQKGTVVVITMIGIMYSNMYTFDWMPVMAIPPGRPAYHRLPGKASIVAMELMPYTPGYPLMVRTDPSRGGNDSSAYDGFAADDMGEGEMDGLDDSALDDLSLDLKSAGKKKKKRKKRRDEAMNITFEFRIEAECPRHCVHPLGHPECPAIFIASNFPYPYQTLQRNLSYWGVFAARSQSQGSSTSEDGSIYFHREVLCKTLEGRNVDLITISDRSGILGARMPLCSVEEGLSFPYSSAVGLTERPFQFSVNKQFVVLTSRVHAGETPASFMMHGALDFLTNTKDLRSVMLRQRFVFIIVPMINPDGVVRGHSRVDANGVDLNRTYRDPCPRRQPAPFALNALLRQLSKNHRLALFVDMHAHANKKGTFFYGNAMRAEEQVQNLLFAKLVSLNTPYFEFNSCNFSESNMFAVGKSGKGKDNSCRVVLFQETGLIHSYVIETSHVAGKYTNPIVPISGIPGEDNTDLPPPGISARYSPATFADTGKAILVALLDLKGINPVSRLSLTPYHSLRGLNLWLHRQLQIEISEKIFMIALNEHGKVDWSDSTRPPLSMILSCMSPRMVPDKMTIRNARLLPPVSMDGVRVFVPLDVVATLLAQTPPSGPPRSVICGRRGPSGTGQRTSPYTGADACGRSNDGPPTAVARSRQER